MDVRYGFRALRKTPAFTVVGLITLLLGIGANVVVFGVLNAVLLRPLGVKDQQNLYQIRHRQWMKGRLLTTSYPAFQDLRRRNTTFSGMTAVYGYSGAELRWGNAVTRVQGDEVSGNYFDLLGVRPQLGRFFHEVDEHGAGSAPYVVLSDDLWRRTFNSDRAAVGTVVQLNGHPFTVLGVVPVAFHGLERFVWPDYWLPMMNEAQVEGSDYLRNRKGTPVTVIGRLKPGVTAPQATENLNEIVAELAREYPQTDDGVPLRLIHPGLWGDEGDVIRGFLYGVNLLALLVLAAACANLANLFSARAADRSRELAVRVALGSSQWRLAKQLLIEAGIVSLIGGAAGFLGASLLLRMLDRWRPEGTHLAVSVDWRVYVASVGLTAASAALFGLVPARHAWRSSPLQAMKSGPVSGIGTRRFALRDLLLGGQIAICTLLVTASLVAVRGMERALSTRLGIRPEGAMLADMDLSDAGFARVRELVDAARGMAGVQAAGMINRAPLNGGGLRGIPIYTPGTTEFTLQNYALAPYVFSMSPGYLEAAGTRLLGGRDVSWQDTAERPRVAIVNETFAQRMWGRARAVGQRFILWGNLTEVVGMVEDGKYHDLTEAPYPALFVPLSQSQQEAETLVVRSRRGPREMAGALESTLGGLVSSGNVTPQSWIDELSTELFPARAAALTLGVMGLLAAMLAVTGIFGMAAYNVSRRLKEFGIRVALGAGKQQVMSAALGRAAALLGVGSIVGLAAGIAASRLLGHIVYQANPGDPAVIGGTALTMALLGILATVLPARRALSVDPSTLMRDE